MIDDLRSEYFQLREERDAMRKGGATVTKKIESRMAEIVKALGSQPRKVSETRKQHFEQVSKHNKGTVRIGSVTTHVDPQLPRFAPILREFLKEKEARDCQARIVISKELLEILSDVNVSDLYFYCIN
jgi:hypothetical protein